MLRDILFVNLKDKTRVLPTALKDGAILINSCSAVDPTFGGKSKCATSDPVSTRSVPPVKRFAKATPENVKPLLLQKGN